MRIRERVLRSRVASREIREKVQEKEQYQSNLTLKISEDLYRDLRSLSKANNDEVSFSI